MAQLGGTFDPGAVPADPNRGNFDLINPGWYPAQVIENEVTRTKSGGQMLKLTWEILSGQYGRRRVWQNINIENASAKAQEIGQRNLADVCEATGAGAISDGDDLQFKPCMMRVGIEKQQGYEDKNVVKAVKPMDGQTTAEQRPAPATQPARGGFSGNATSAPQQQAQPARAASGGGAPWRK